MRRCAFVLLLFATAASSRVAADAGLGLVGSYTFEHASPDDQRIIVGNLNGFRIGVDVPLQPIFGLVGSVDADWGDTYKTGAIFIRAGNTERIRTYGVTGGPRVAFKIDRVSPWATVTLGWVHVEGRAIAVDANVPLIENTFTGGFGGGVDVVVTRHFDVRLVDLEYQRSTFHDQPLNRTMVSVGGVWRLSRR